MTPKNAAAFVSLYWAGAMMGRFAGSAVMHKVRASRVLGTAAFIVLALLTTSMLSSRLLAMGSMLMVGMFNSIMFPSIFTLGITGLGPLTGKGSGILMAAAVGGAVVPVLEGLLATALAFITLSSFQRFATSISPITRFGALLRQLRLCELPDHVVCRHRMMLDAPPLMGSK